MANFTLNIATDSSAELLDIVSKIAGSMPLPQVQIHGGGAVTERRMPTLDDFKQAERVVAGIEALEKAQAAGQAVIDDIAPERDAHGIKRDLRIHADAKEPLRASDNLWKRRKNVPDEQYEEIHLELVREARAAGLYTGPAIPELELESRVVDTTVSEEVLRETDPAIVAVGMAEAVESGMLVPSPSMQTALNEASEIEQQLSASAPAVAPPAPVPAAPAPGMSAEATPTYTEAVTKLVQQCGAQAPIVMLRVMGVKVAPELSPEQLRVVMRAADMVKLDPMERITKGAQAVTEAFISLGVEVDGSKLADLGVVI